ncbi:MAG: NUDIX hydrolase [Nitrospirae bacterium]|nr:MAG: NUDIX hydrolase [Nitrospirota bacterium]
MKNQVSSGGVIFRTNADKTEIALIAVKGGNVLSLPKGIVDKGESPEETAVREVREETGLRGRIKDKIGEISYWYYIKGENARCRKTVHFYLMEYLSGSTKDHDAEVDDAAWFPLDEALGKVSYKGDREIIEKAKGMIKKIE